MQEMVVGDDHHFGQNRTGSEKTLLEMASDHRFTVDVIPPKVFRHNIVSR